MFRGGIGMQAIWSEKETQDMFVDNKEKTNGMRYDTRLEIARQATKMVRSMSKLMAYDITKQILDMMRTEERRQHEG
jgi:hypothetical protein